MPQQAVTAGDPVDSGPGRTLPTFPSPHGPRSHSPLHGQQPPHRAWSLMVPDVPRRFPIVPPSRAGDRVLRTPALYPSVPGRASTPQGQWWAGVLSATELLPRAVPRVTRPGDLPGCSFGRAFPRTPFFCAPPPPHLPPLPPRVPRLLRCSATRIPHAPRTTPHT